MKAKGWGERLFHLQRLSLALSVVMLPGCVITWATNSPLLDAISLSVIWLVPGLAYLYLCCSTLPALHRLLVFLLPFGRMHSTGLITFCWLWPLSIPLFRKFNRLLDEATRK